MIAATPASSKRRPSSIGGELGGLGPAFDRDLAVLGVDADGDLARKGAAGLAHEIRDRAPRPCRGSRGARRARASPRSSPGRGCRRRAAPECRRASRIASTAARIDRLAREGAVEIDDVQPVRSPGLEGRCACAAGIVIEDGRLRHVALLEAHALAVLEVDGGKQDHGRHLRKLAMSARPSAWLFSGWNWRAGHVVARRPWR